MSGPRCFADHDLDDRILRGWSARDAGISVTRAREVGLHAEDDPILLQYAAEHGLITLSSDVRTMRAYAIRRLDAGLAMPGLVLIRQGLPIGESIEDLLLIAISTTRDEWIDRIEFLPL